MCNILINEPDDDYVRKVYLRERPPAIDFPWELSQGDHDGRITYWQTRADECQTNQARNEWLGVIDEFNRRKSLLS